MATPNELKGREAQREDRQVRAALERLRECHETDEKLAEKLPVEASTLRNYFAGAEIPENIAEQVYEVQRQIEQRNSKAYEAGIALLQTIEVIEEEVLTREQIKANDERWKRLKRQTERLLDDLT